MKKLYIPAFAGEDTTVASWGKLVINGKAPGAGAAADLGRIKEGSVSFSDNGTEQTLYSTGHILEALKRLTEVEISFQLILPSVATLNAYVDVTGIPGSYTLTPEEGQISMTANNAVITGTPMWAEDTGFYVDAKLRCTPPATAGGKTFTFAAKA